MPEEMLKKSNRSVTWPTLHDQRELVLLDLVQLYCYGKRMRRFRPFAVVPGVLAVLLAYVGRGSDADLWKEEKGQDNVVLPCDTYSVLLS